MVEILRTIFGGDAPDLPLHWGQVAARAIVVYLAGLLIVRLGKSRLLSRATPLDVILAFMLGSILSRGITGSAAISHTVVASATLVLAHWAFTALACRSHWWGDVIKGRTHVLVSDSEIDHSNMRRSHISEHDLYEALHLNANIDDLGQVAAAYKERSGEISIVRKTLEPKVIDVAVRDGVQTVRIVLGQEAGDRSQAAENRK